MAEKKKNSIKVINTGDESISQGSTPYVSGKGFGWVTQSTQCPTNTVNGDLLTQSRVALFQARLQALLEIDFKKLLG